MMDAYIITRLLSQMSSDIVMATYLKAMRPAVTATVKLPSTRLAVKFWSDMPHINQELLKLHSAFRESRSRLEDVAYHSQMSYTMLLDRETKKRQPFRAKSFTGKLKHFLDSVYGQTFVFAASVFGAVSIGESYASRFKEARFSNERKQKENEEKPHPSKDNK